jgi:DNA polymerase-3 subunit epsilon
MVTSNLDFNPFPNFVPMNFVIVDVETTGGNTKDSKITELAMYKYDGEKVIDSFISLVNPEQTIPEFIVRLTGITDAMVADAPKFFELAKGIIEFTNDCVFVAHNVAFDYGMFRSEFRRLGFDFRMPHLCTVRSSRYVIPGHASYSLGKLCREIGIDNNARHRADGDAKATTELFHLIYHKDPNNLSTFIQQELNPKSIHPNLSLEVIDNLPTKAGVYMLYNEFNQLIYIGKSINIKKRIEQHLRNTKTAKGLKMIQDICRIEHELTGSELIAMLIESELIKKHQPIYNRKLRKSFFPFGIFDTVDERGYVQLQVLSMAKTEAQAIIQFSTKKEGTDYLSQLTEKFELCQKLNHLYPTQSACFHYTIKACKGACVQEESSDAYNSRIDELLEHLNFKRNSFFIVDKGRNKGEKSIVWIDRGTYKGYGFAPFHFHGKEPMHWMRYIQLEQENRDNKSIINLFIRKDKRHRIVPV